MNGTGLDHDGFIEREGDLARVPQAFAPVIEATKAAIQRAFGPSRLHSAYLYGSIPRGTPVPEVSALDILLALNDEPTDGDRSAASRLENDLDAMFPQINGVGILLYSTATLLSDIERNDLGWFVACLCTPLIGARCGQRPQSPALQRRTARCWACSSTTSAHGWQLSTPPCMGGRHLGSNSA
jgi:hypothetical protein